jgi:hypothetical protein
MTNTIYEYDTFFRKNMVVRDFTSVYFNNLQTELEKYSYYFTIINITEDERIENVAYQLYGDENLSDLLLAINDENFIWSSPLSQDILMDQTDMLLTEFGKNLNIDTWDGNVNYQDFASKIEEFIDESNSRRKKFKVPKLEYLSDVLNIVNGYKLKNKDLTLKLDSYEE